MSDVDRIEARAGVLAGTPCVKGRRRPVRDVLAYLARGDSIDALPADFAYVARAGVLACLASAAELANHPQVIAAE